jgi:MFS family permease
MADLETPRSDIAQGQPSPFRLPRNVWVVTITSFLTDISSEMLFNLLPIFLFNVLGARTDVIGVIEGVAESTASLLKLVSGWLSDRLRKRKALAVLGYALSTLAKPLLYLADNWVWVLGMRFADRTGKGLRTAPRDALVADSIDERHRGLAFGLHRAGDTGGAVVGILIALVVVLSMEGSGMLQRSTFQRIVLLSLIPAALAVLVLALGAHDVVPKEKASPAAADRVETKIGLDFRKRDRPFFLFLGIMVIFTLGNSSDAFLILRAEQAGLSVAGILGMMLSFNLIYALLSGPAGALSDRIGRKTLMVAGWSLYAAVYLGFAGANAGWQTWALMCVYGVYYGISEGVARAFVADLVPALQRGSAYGAYHAAVGLTALPASLIAGVLWQGVGAWSGFGPSAPFLFGAAMALAAVVLLTSLKPANRPLEATPKNGGRAR